MRLSDRLQSLPPYHFAAYSQKIAEKRAAGIDVISLSMGDPDLATPAEIVETLVEAARQPVNQRYPEYAGTLEFRQAIVAWFQRRFAVALDPEREVLPLIGSKEGLAHLPLAVINPGDLALMPDPRYPVYSTAVLLAGGENYDLPLESARGWLPDLSRVPAEVADRATTLWLNYPNNPTGVCAPLAFFNEAVRFAREYDVILVNDMAYAEVRYDGYRPASLLEVPGAKDVAVEFHSLSKAYNMAGFRLGMVVGNETIVGALNTLKSNIDTGIFRPIQAAGAQALNLPETWIEERNAVYQRRRDRMVDACRRLSMTVEVPRAGLYVWARIPERQTSAQFALNLLDRAGIAVTPGTNFGASGEGYVRIALTVPDARLDEAIARMEAAADIVIA
jgi:LL-diaminopimelate aminotransferase